MTAIICRGTGTWGPRMRLWRTGEILCITLRCAHGKSGPYRANRTSGQSAISAGE